MCACLTLTLHLSKLLAVLLYSSILQNAWFTGVWEFREVEGVVKINVYGLQSSRSTERNFCRHKVSYVLFHISMPHKTMDFYVQTGKGIMVNGCNSVCQIVHTFIRIDRWPQVVGRWLQHRTNGIWLQASTKRVKNRQ